MYSDDRFGMSIFANEEPSTLRQSVSVPVADTTVSVASAQTAEDIAALVHVWFETYLGRTSPAEEAAWVAAVTSGGYTLDYVRAGIANSYEALSRLLPGWFKTYLGRSSPDEEKAWAMSGQTARQIEEHIANSGEATAYRLARGQPATIAIPPEVVPAVLSVATPGAPARLVSENGSAVVIEPTTASAPTLKRVALWGAGAFLALKLLQRTKGRR